MLPVLAGLASIAVAGPPDVPDAGLPWYRQAEVTVGLGSAANSHADGLLPMARLSAGWRWNRRVGIELVGTASPDFIAATPAITFRPVTGPVQPVFSTGLGVGAASAFEGCGGPFDGSKGCGWSSRAGFQDLNPKAVLRASAGVRVDVDPVWVMPVVDFQVQNASLDSGWELSFAVTVGFEHEEDVAPDWVVRSHERRARQRLERVQRDIYSSNRAVAVDAWNVLLGEYPETPPGERRDAYEAHLVEALQTGLFSQREAAWAYRHHGTRIDVLEPALSARPMDCAAAAKALRIVAERTGREAEAYAMLGRAPVTCDVSAARFMLAP
jgi:hypothetical protein